jgi:hypothetical protein
MQQNDTRAIAGAAHEFLCGAAPAALEVPQGIPALMQIPTGSSAYQAQWDTVVQPCLCFAHYC